MNYYNGNTSYCSKQNWHYFLSVNWFSYVLQKERECHCIVLVLISSPNIFWEITIENYIFFCINLLYYEYVVASNCLSQSCLKCLLLLLPPLFFFCLRPLNHGQHRYRSDYVCSTLSTVFNIHINKRNVYLVYS